MSTNKKEAKAPEEIKENDVVRDSTVETPQADNAPEELKVEEEIKPLKYVILRHGNHWELKDPGMEFVLSHGREGCKPYAFYSNIKKEIKARILIAVKVHELDFTDDPATYAPPENNVINRMIEPRLKTNEFDRQDVKDNKAAPNAPQMTNGGMVYMNEKSPAWKLIKNQSQKVRELLPGFVAQLDGKQDKVKFLREAMAIERKGFNPSMHPRTIIVDLLDEYLLKLGVKQSIVSTVMVENDKESEKIAPLKI